jgi:hypothetical protein
MSGIAGGMMLANYKPIVAATDPHFANVTLLISGGEANNSTTIVDKSSYARTTDNSVGVLYSTAQTKFASSSIFFDGSNDYFSYNNIAELEFPGDFTVEFWARPVTKTSFQAVIGTGLFGRCLISKNPGWYLEADNGTTPVAVTISGASGGYVLNTWQHIAFTRSGNTFKAFKDGTQFGSTITNSVTLETTAGFFVGQFGNGGSYWQGYLEQLRVTRGVARYTANFTAPTAAFPTS